MKATEARFLEFLKRSPLFVIPLYQRAYSWTIKECQQLWDDILRTGKNSDVAAHFIGSIVYIEKGLYQITGQTPLLVIDGQQRLTTVMLLLEALARAVGDQEPVDGFSQEKIRQYYLINALEKEDRRYKLLLSKTDKDSLISILRGKELAEDCSIRVKENFDFFRDRIEELDDHINVICNGISKLVIVDLALSRDQDNPQLIFESMNSTGRELTQADLIRNYILMGLEPEHQNKLYNDHWRPMEVEFGQEGYSVDSGPNLPPNPD